MARDLRIEGLLNRNGVRWQYRDAIPLKAINKKASLNNQARPLNAIDPSIKDDYARFMRRGDAFPAIVVYERDGQYTIMTGNHRFLAAEEIGRLSFDAYLVEEASEVVIERLTRVLNAIEGARPNREESIMHALALMDRLGYTATAAAAELGLSHAIVQREHQVAQVRPRLAALGVKAERIGKDVLAILYGIDNTAILGAVGSLVVEAKLSKARARELLGAIRSAGDEKAQLAVVAAWRELPEIQRAIAETAKGTLIRRPDPWVAVHRFARSLSSMLERYPTLSAMGVRDGDQATLLLKEFERLSEAMMTVQPKRTPPTKPNGHARQAHA